MNTQKLTRDVSAFTVKEDNGDNSLTTAETPVLERVAFAEGMSLPPLELLERYEAILDAYTARLEKRIEMNAQKAIELRKHGAQAGLELGEPYSGPIYKWQDLFVVGPIQNITMPPFLPHKIIAAGEPAFFFAFVVKNPLPTPGNGPSALTVMNGRPFNLNAEIVNLTRLGNGPDIKITSAFNRDVVQAFLLAIKARMPQQGKPDLYEINVTLDVTDGFLQPIASFATSIMDIDCDPGFPIGPAYGSHLHVEQPLRFLVYKR